MALKPIVIYTITTIKDILRELDLPLKIAIWTQAMAAGIVSNAKIYSRKRRLNL
jgi:hypothetical protein